MDDIDVDEVLLLSNIRSFSGGIQQEEGTFPAVSVTDHSLTTLSVDLSTLANKTRTENLKEELEQLWPWIIRRIAWKERSLQGKLAFIALAPLYLLENATIPQTSEDKWAKPFAVLQPTFGAVLVMLAYDCAIPIPCSSSQRTTDL